MSSASAAATSATASSTAVTNEQQKIVSGFQKLREHQQATIAELAKMQAEHREHGTVLKAIRSLKPDAKCFRQVGDTLFEFKASELVVILEETIKKFEERAAELEEHVVKMGEELNAYKEKHNIRFLSNKDVMDMQRKQAMAQIQQLDIGQQKKEQQQKVDEDGAKAKE